MKTISTGVELKRYCSQKKEEQTQEQITVVIPQGTCCRACGSEAIVDAFREELDNRGLQGKVKILETGCHGFCQLEPFVVIQPKGILYHQLTPSDIVDIVEKTIIGDEIVERLCYQDPNTKERIPYEHDIPFYKKQKRILLSQATKIDPTDINDYFSIGGYQALFKALDEMSPESVVDEVKSSGLRGRGGAGFPTGKKWELARVNKSDEKYIICNADEGDPGAYMDRSLLEGNPHAVIEGMILGAYAIGATKGFIYVRDEYPLAVKHINIALEQAREFNLLGTSVGNNGFSFDIEVDRGAGAFVCGEETALISSIEGKGGEPRQRPPYPAEKGLWGKPTNINNVETLANIPGIIRNGAAEYASIGTENSKGTKIFALVGKIKNTGLVEVPMGMTLKEIIYDIGGGIPNGKKFKAVQTGGPSGGCIPAKLLDLPVDYDELANAGSIMGSGGMVVLDEDTCIVDFVKYFLEFSEKESCGKCFSCREGTTRLHEIVTRFSDGVAKLEDIDQLEQLAHTVKHASMCGLGQSAPNPVISTLRYFREEYELHAREKRCPAAVCQQVISSPCQHTCPIDTDAPSYIGLISHGKFADAAATIRADNPLPSVCARVCSRPCESKCRSGKFGEPISIRNLKRFAMEYESLDQPGSSTRDYHEYSESVGIVGSGPAGLMASYKLAEKGYKVTVYESQPVVGGMLALTIPDYRLPKDVLQRDIDYIQSAGVQFETNTTVGKDVSWSDLEDRHDALFIAAGAHNNLKLGIPGEEAPQVFDVIEFLKNVKLGDQGASGVVAGIIGGGDAAIDAARTAYRTGYEKVMILYRRTLGEMPADYEEIEQAEKEGTEFSFLIEPRRVISSQGKVTGLECRRMQLGSVDSSGRARPVPIEGTEFVVDLDTLIVAIGQKPDLDFVSERTELDLTRWNTVAVNPETLQTSIPKVFAGGDVVTGPANVIKVMAAGKTAADSIHQFLRDGGIVKKFSVTRPRHSVDPLSAEQLQDLAVNRPEMPCIPLEERLGDFLEVELGIEEQSAIEEAKRCLRCDLDTSQTNE